MPLYKTVTGIVINKRNYKDNDLVITLLTPNYGKINCLAKGAKNIKSRRLGHLQLGNTIKASLFEKNNFSWLSESTSIKSFMQSSKNLVQLNLLFLFLEFINQLIPENQNTPKVYEICQKIISAIDKNQLKTYISNEINLIKTLGFGIPDDIINSYNTNNFKLTQNLLKNHFESILEKPIESNRLFM